MIRKSAVVALMVLLPGCLGAGSQGQPTVTVTQIVEVPRYREDSTPNLIEVHRVRIDLPRLSSDPPPAPRKWTLNVSLTKFWLEANLWLADFVAPPHSGVSPQDSGFRFEVFFGDDLAVCLRYWGTGIPGSTTQRLRAFGEAAVRPPENGTQVSFKLEGYGDGYGEFVVSDADPYDVPTPSSGPGQMYRCQ